MSRNMRRLVNRVGYKPCDICGNAGILVTHHIRGRDIPHCNHKSNLADICSNCHMDCHSGKIIIEKWMNSTDGLILLWHKAGEPSITGDDSVPHQIRQAVTI